MIDDDEMIAVTIVIVAFTAIAVSHCSSDRLTLVPHSVECTRSVIAMADDGESTSVSHIPNSMRALRACLNCRLLQQTRQWQEADCPNGCRWDGSWQANTTPVFKGVLAMMQPEFSWVARWQKQGQSEFRRHHQYYYHAIDVDMRCSTCRSLL